MSRLTTGRFRHLFILPPLGGGVGLLIGLLFRDITFGVLVGTGFGLLYGLLFAIRNPK